MCQKDTAPKERQYLEPGKGVSKENLHFWRYLQASKDQVIRHSDVQVDPCGSQGTFQSSTWNVFTKYLFDGYIFDTPPDVILVEGLIVELVFRLEFCPNWRTPTLQEFINWILIFAVHIGLGKHLEVGLKIVAGSDMTEHGVDLAGICARLLYWDQASNHFHWGWNNYSTCLRNWLQGKPKILKGLSAYWKRKTFKSILRFLR